MPKIDNPDNILIKNHYYTSGLTEGEIWDYYQRYKNLLLDETKNRDLMVAIFVDENKHILKRTGKTTKFIRLSSQNFNEVVHPRVVTIYSTMKRSEDIGIIDLDIEDFNKGKEAAIDVYNFVSTKIPFVIYAEIRFTGKSAFHIFCNLNKKYPIDNIRKMFHQYLSSNEEFRKKYTIAYKRTKRIVNLDLSPNKYRGAFITKHSLSLIGLKCMSVSVRKLKSFKKYDGRI